MGEEGNNTTEMVFETLTSQVLLYLGGDFHDILSQSKVNPITRQNVSHWDKLKPLTHFSKEVAFSHVLMQPIFTSVPSLQ